MDSCPSLGRERTARLRRNASFVKREWAPVEAIDRDPGEIDLIINSHFHFDHVGGNALIPNATMLVQRREWDAGMDPDTAAQLQPARLRPRP